MTTQVVLLTAGDLQLRDLAALPRLRADFEGPHERRPAQRRFRRDPVTYLAKLEQQLLKQGVWM